MKTKERKELKEMKKKNNLLIISLIIIMISVTACDVVVPETQDKLNSQSYAMTIVESEDIADSVKAEDLVDPNPEAPGESYEQYLAKQPKSNMYLKDTGEKFYYVQYSSNDPADELGGRLEVVNEETKNFYVGELYGSRPNGRGKYYTIDNSYNKLMLLYEGNYVDGKVQGYGKAYYLTENNSVEYEGEFENNKMHGSGKLYYESGKVVYDGEFNMNNKEGTGVLYYESGNKAYEGEFYKDNFEGKGNYYRDDKKNTVAISGTFLNGKPHGQCWLYDENRNNLGVYEFENGEFKGQLKIEWRY